MHLSYYGHYAGQFYGHLTQATVEREVPVSMTSQVGRQVSREFSIDFCIDQCKNPTPLWVEPPLSCQISSSKKAGQASYEEQVKAAPAAHSLFHQLWPPRFLPFDPTSTS